MTIVHISLQPLVQTTQIGDDFTLLFETRKLSLAVVLRRRK